MLFFLILTRANNRGCNVLPQSGHVSHVLENVNPIDASLMYGLHIIRLNSFSLVILPDSKEAEQSEQAEEHQYGDDAISKNRKTLEAKHAAVDDFFNSREKQQDAAGLWDGEPFRRC